jgi:hypothetical protein
MGLARVQATTYLNVTMNLYGDGTLVYSHAVTDDLPFRLPSGKSYRDWEVELVGTDTVEAVDVCGIMAELESA